MKSNTREHTSHTTHADKGMSTPGGSSTEMTMRRTLWRFMTVMMASVGALVAGLVLLTLTGCDDDDDEPYGDSSWYITGVWQNTSAPDETMTFYDDGTGYWSSAITGSYLDFDYYCYDDDIYFTMYPAGSAAYTLDCDIDFYNQRSMSIEWPPSSMYGPTTIYYTRVQ